MKALIGTYFGTKEKAVTEMKRKNKLHKITRFVVVEFKNGFMVISEEQLEALK
jgi:hypothetical protein